MKSKWLSRSIIGCCFGIVTSLAIVGCVTETQYVTVDGKPIPQVSESYKKALQMLPPDAKNVVELGNNYFTYEIDGQKMLFHFYWGSHQVVHRSSCPLTKPCTCATMSEPKETKRGEGPGLVE